MFCQPAATGLAGGVRGKVTKVGGRLADGFVEQAVAKRGSHQGTNAHGACGLAEDGDVVRVAAEGANVVLYPLQSRKFVQQAVVAAGAMFRLGAQCRVGEKSPRSKAVVDAHYDHTLACQLGAVEDRRMGKSNAMGATMEPNHHRQRLLGMGFTLAPNV